MQRGEGNREFDGVAQFVGFFRFFNQLELVPLSGIFGLKTTESEGVDVQGFSLVLRRVVGGECPQLLVEVFPGLGHQAGSEIQTGNG